MSVTNETPAAQKEVVGPLLPIMACVLVAFLVVGLGLPVLPLHVDQQLGFGPFMVGLVSGSQFAASLISRVWAGRYSDRNGAKRGVMVGLGAASLSGLLYLLSLAFLLQPSVSVLVLLLGRAVLGVAESFIITGAVSWGLFRLGSGSSGMVIAWIGMAMFTALAVGAPAGIALYVAGGFTAVAIATVAAPLATAAMIAPLAGVPGRSGTSAGLLSVVDAVWLPGTGAALASVGYGAILAFGTLLFVERGWTPVWLAFTAYAGALVVTRVFLGGLPDKLGGARVALAFMTIEAAGLALVWSASGPILAAVGAALTGLGYSLVYPGLGAEAIRRAPAASRGVTMGLYTACLDVALGFGSPMLGLLAGWTGIGPIFLASALVVLAAVPVALILMKR
jgi:MFS family permease